MAVRSDKTTLTCNQARAIRELMVHRTIENAAKAAGVSERTIYRWLQEPDFRLALSIAEGNAIDDAVRTQVADLKDNHAVMRQIRDDGEMPGSLRLRAAQALDNSLLHWRELRDVESRLASLETEIYGQD